MSDWTVVEEESPSVVIFDTHGDVFMGTYTGRYEIDMGDGESFIQLRFRNPDGYFAINGGYKLLGAFEKIEIGTECRITYVKDVDTGQPSPMKDFRVETR